MRSNAGMVNRQGDIDLHFAQVFVPQLEHWLSLAWPAKCTMKIDPKSRNM